MGHREGMGNGTGTGEEGQDKVGEKCAKCAKWGKKG